MRPAARSRYERSPLRPAQPLTSRRHVMGRPESAAELDSQLREIVEHHYRCRWVTGPYRQPGEPLTATEDRACTCTAVYRRRHLLDVITAAASGQLPPAVTAPRSSS